MKKIISFILLALILVSCESSKTIVNNLDERSANEIVVYLASKGIAAQKIQAGSTGPGTGATNLWNIFVDEKKQVDAMTLLNQVGLPRIKGTNLLTLFDGKSLMKSDKEENIRYQAGIEEELKNIIRKIDGVLDADVRISFPQAQEVGFTATQTPKIKAAVYIKHQGIFDDPNQHLDSKIKRLVAGSIDNLSFDDVTVISDKSRIADIQMIPDVKTLGPRALDKEYVKIWSIIMTKNSASKFRTIFFTMIFLILIFAGLMGYLIYKFYPEIQKKIKASKK
ncbi:MAG: Nodulation protein NolT [Candidatus Anoxychlamydiales bacterium]|nr:Nodulation protein NolT [Candidatus Anoxychlamydiales bacterium]